MELTVTEIPDVENMRTVVVEDVTEPVTETGRLNISAMRKAAMVVIPVC